MGALARMAIALPALGALGAAAMDAWDNGHADQAVHEAGAVLGAGPDEAKPPREVLERLEARLGAAVARVPQLPTGHELLARISEERTERPDCFFRAEAQYRAAIGERPTSPYAWSGLARAKYRQGDTGQVFEAALARAAELGPGEPDIQRAVEDYGLATWDDIAPGTRQSVVRMIANGMRRDPVETLQIAGRRGRLAVACAQRDAAAPRSRMSWEGLCKAREAKP